MATSSYSERDYAFGQIILTLRTSIGLTQSGLAEQLGISRRAVAEWEAGSSYPKVEHLKHLIALGVKQQAFSRGHEAEEICTLWQLAHQKVLFDEQWLSTLLAQQQPAQPQPPPGLAEEHTTRVEEATAQPAVWPHVDWGDAPTLPNFYGREEELALLTAWIVQERCRVVSVLGMGGIGKSALAVHLMHEVSAHFEIVLFRSLRNAPSCDVLLDDCLQQLSPQRTSTVSASFEQRLSLLLEQLGQARILVVLDNLEAVLEGGDTRGRFRPGYEGYGVLLRRMAEREQRSCLLLTSREKPAEVRAPKGKRSPVRSLRLGGLNSSACAQLFAAKEAFGTPQEQARLVEAYAGNPLALKIVAETITDLFGGEINQFLAENTMIFGTIADLLAEHFNRLSPIEQTIVRWMAIAREPVTIEELRAMLVTPLPRVQLFEAIDSLRRRSLIEQGQHQGSFTLQSVVLEYMTEVLITEATSEIQQYKLDYLLQHGLELAHTKEYVRQTQNLLLVAPLLANLQRAYQGRAEVEARLLLLLDQMRTWADSAQGYGPANLLALLRLQRGHLCNLDLSRLAIRDAYLQGVEMQDASLSEATLRETIFTEAFKTTWSVAISSTGKFWAAGSERGEVQVWREGGQHLYPGWQAHTDNIYTLAFSPDERILATGSWDGTLKLWNLEHGSLLWTGWHADIVRSVAFAPDGQTLASGGDDAVIQFRAIADGRLIQTLQHAGPVFSVVWSPDGHLLVSGGSDGIIRLWQIQKNQPVSCIQTFEGHTDWVRGLAFTPDGTQLASASGDRTVKLWDIASGQMRQSLPGHTDRVRVVAWSPDGRTLASAGFDKTIWLWDGERGGYRSALHGHGAVIYSLAFTPDSRSLLSGSEDGTLRIWSVESGECVRILKGYVVTLYDLAWSPDGTQLATAGADMCVTIWDVAASTPPRVLHGHRWGVQGIAWSPDGRLLASAGWDNAIGLWDTTTGVRVQTLLDPDHIDAMFQNIAWSPDGRLLASGSYLHGVQVWNMTMCTRLWVGHAHQTMIRCVEWSPDSTRLASCGDDGSICLWEATTGTLLASFRGHSAGVMSIAWSPDGRQLASGGNDRGGGKY